MIFLFRKSGNYEPEEIRRRKLAALARKLQLQFNPKNDSKLAERFLFLTWLKRGDVPDVRYAYNVFHGLHLGYPVTFFYYRFSTSGGTQKWIGLLLVGLRARNGNKFSRLDDFT